MIHQEVKTTVCPPERIRDKMAVHTFASTWNRDPNGQKRICKSTINDLLFHSVAGVPSVRKTNSKIRLPEFAKQIPAHTNRSFRASKRCILLGRGLPLVSRSSAGISFVQRVC